MNYKYFFQLPPVKWEMRNIFVNAADAHFSIRRRHGDVSLHLQTFTRTVRCLEEWVTWRLRLSDTSALFFIRGEVAFIVITA